MPQISLEHERTSKVLLLRDADKAKESLLEERALREAERNRLAVEVDARKKLETLLASEREKEQVERRQTHEILIRAGCRGHVENGF